MIVKALRPSSFRSIFLKKSRNDVRLPGWTALTLGLALATATFMYVLRVPNRTLSVFNIPDGNGPIKFMGLDYRGLVKDEPRGRKLAWIMSFPNSGTSYTSRLIRDLTRTDSASNYADETSFGRAGHRFPVYEDMPDGPFWLNAEPELEYTKPTEYVLTKTHCGLRCVLCPPEKYIESTFSFRSSCLKTKWVHVNETAGTNDRVFSSYVPDRLTKAIHLIRDPFDNVVSRFHLERQIPGREAEKFGEDREGFRSYCKSIDSRHRASEKRVIFLSEPLLEILRVVPCHEDFIRYIEWHNLAFVTTRDMQLNTYVLHYDWFRTRYNETTNELLEFLRFQIHQNGVWTPFNAGFVYYNYFTNEEKQALKQAFKIMSSTETWSHIVPYFEGIQDNKIIPIAEMVSKRPALNTLVQEGSKTKIIGDVQFLLDFAIVGYPKTGTSTKVRWLASQKEIQMYDHEIYHLKDNEPADMVRKLYALPAGDQFKRGYKAPRDIHNPPAIKAFNKYFPKTKFIVGLRHPVLWFESLYNYRIRSKISLPPPNEMIGNCTKEMYNLCTEEIRYMDHLSAMGKTDRTDPKELELLSPVLPRHRKAPKMNNSVFLYEISQMEETDETLASQYRKDLQKYLGLSQPIEPLSEKKESHTDSPFMHLFIDICDPQYAAVHDDLMDIAVKSSTWLRKFFLPLPDVYVSSPDHFKKLIGDWLIDPCVVRKSGTHSSNELK